MNLTLKKILCSCWFYIQSALIAVGQINTWKEYGKLYMEFVTTAILLLIITTLLYSKSKTIKRFCSKLLIVYSIGLLYFGVLVVLVASPRTYFIAFLIILLPIIGIFISLLLQITLIINQVQKNIKIYLLRLA